MRTGRSLIPLQRTWLAAGLLAAAGVIWAADDANPGAPPPPAPPQENARVNTPADLPPAPVPATPAVVTLSHGTNGTEQLIQLTLDDVPLAEVVKLFTRVSGANIIAATSNLQGQVTASLQDVPWRPALESILERQGLLLTEKPPASNIFVIESRKTSEDPHFSETIPLSYVKVEDVTKVVQGVLGKDGTVMPFPSGNMIIVNSTMVRIAEVRKIVESLDRPRTQVYIEAKFVQLTEGATKDLGIDWQSLSGYKIGITPSADISRNRSRTGDQNTTTKHLYDVYGNEGQELDHYETVTLPGGGTESVPIYKATTTITDTKDVQNTMARNLGAVLNPSEFDIVLSALEGSTGAKVISNPTLIVANEQKALIKIAEDEPNVKVTLNQAPPPVGSSSATTVGYLRSEEIDASQPYFTFGITLEVTPRINNTSNITVTVKPEISTKNYTDTLKFDDGNVFPAIDKKTVETVFSLADGHTAAIGGLTQTSDNDTDSKIPLLGDIPWLGPRLFSHKSRSHTRSELMIFVTVGLVDPATVSATNGFKQEMTLMDKQITGKP